MGNFQRTSCDDEKMALEGVGRAQAVANGQELAGRASLLRGERGLEDLGVEAARGKELDVDADAGPRRQVAHGIGGGQAGDLLDGDGVAAQGEAGDELEVLAEARQDGGVAKLGVLVDEVVGDGGAERVADVDELGELGVDAAHGALAELAGELRQGSDLERLLDLVDGVALGGGAHAEAVPGEGRVAVLVDGLGDVAVVVVVEGKVPVAAVEAHAVGQDLEGLAGAVVRLAVGGCDAVFAADGVVLREGCFVSIGSVVLLVGGKGLTPVKMSSV